MYDLWQMPPICSRPLRAQEQQARIYLLALRYYIRARAQGTPSHSRSGSRQIGMMGNARID